VTIESSSIFAKTGVDKKRLGNRNDSALPPHPSDTSPTKNVEFGAGRRLSFRLTAPVALPS
jgi:hypothetical protein